jgi:hypothetical protein
MKRTDILRLAELAKSAAALSQNAEMDRLAEDVSVHFTYNFPITSVHRDDLQQIAGIPDFDTDKITDDQMEEIAEEMADAYTGTDSFWISLSVIVDEMNLPVLGEEVEL